MNADTSCSLITNAIKFTRFEKDRNIVVKIDASLTEPSPKSHEVTYFQSGEARDDPTIATEWGKGETVWILFTVQDTGRGLSMSERDLLFNRFSQASPRTHIQYGGNGLGLFISRRLAELQGGAIGFSSKAGGGSTFSFYIKARRSMAETPRARLGSRRKSENAPNESVEPQVAGQPPIAVPLGDLAKLAPAPVPAPAKLHVLVVEGICCSEIYLNFDQLTFVDNIVNQKVLAKQLRNLGCIVEVANHGVEALNHIETTQYWTTAGTPKELSIVLLDWEMPVMDGITCVRKIRELQLARSIQGHIPVIGVTANARTQQIDQAMKAGMDDVVSKPFRIPDLMTRMHGLLEKLAKG
jgi:CheY-like chemotaxis protein